MYVKYIHLLVASITHHLCWEIHCWVILATAKIRPLPGIVCPAHAHMPDHPADVDICRARNIESLLGLRIVILADAGIHDLQRLDARFHEHDTNVYSIRLIPVKLWSSARQP